MRCILARLTRKHLVTYCQVIYNSLSHFLDTTSSLLAILRFKDTIVCTVIESKREAPFVLFTHLYRC